MLGDINETMSLDETNKSMKTCWFQEIDRISLQVQQIGKERECIHTTRIYVYICVLKNINKKICTHEICC